MVVRLSCTSKLINFTILLASHPPPPTPTPTPPQRSTLGFQARPFVLAPAGPPAPGAIMDFSYFKHRQQSTTKGNRGVAGKWKGRINFPAFSEPQPERRRFDQRPRLLAQLGISRRRGAAQVVLKRSIAPRLTAPSCFSSVLAVLILCCRVVTFKPLLLIFLDFFISRFFFFSVCRFLSFS